MTAMLARAKNEFGAARLLSGAYPAQSASMLVEAMQSACLAALEADGECFDRGTPLDDLITAYPSSAWNQASRRTMRGIAAAAEMYAAAGAPSGDMEAGLEADLPRVAQFIDDAVDYVECVNHARAALG